MSEVLLSTQRLTRLFGGIAAVQDVDLLVRPRELHCVIGPNGAGKSTLLNLLCGTERPSSGSIRYLGREVVGLQVHEFARLGIARKFQIPSVFVTLSIWDNLLIALPRRKRTADATTSIWQMLERLGLSTDYDRPAGALAHGQKQWLEIGMAMMSEPNLLLLDEPTAGMTPEETQKTAQLLLSLRGNLAIIAIEHDMSFVRTLDCHTIVMHQGRLVVDGAFADIERNEMVREIYLGRR
jgi:ABC-type uncharacterized transport system ATPase subunit